MQRIFGLVGQVKSDIAYDRAVLKIQTALTSSKAQLHQPGQFGHLETSVHR